MSKPLAVSWIEPIHFGPFAFPTRLDLDPRVTVLTGPNDVGKSSLLLAIHYCFSDQKATEPQVNQDRREGFGGKWNDDAEVFCDFSFLVTQDALNQKLVGGNLHPGDEMIAFRRINRDERFNIRQVKRENTPVNVGATLLKPPQSVYISSGKVRSLIPLNEINESELKLLCLGFGPAFPKNIAGSKIERYSQIVRAENALNQRLSDILPTALGLKFKLNDVEGNGKELSLSLVDPVNGLVPLGSRGAGVQKLMDLMGSLLSLRNVGTPILLLIDEPENSLHADAQHSLRRLLERLADQPLIQVIYATHSPSMINTMRPSSIRVIERQEKNGKATSLVKNNVFDKNFVRVRSSLGLTPADSLLYAPVTVVVEGPTEVRCLPLLYEKLCTASAEGFADVDDILSQVHFLDGNGDSYEFMVRLAKSQNAKPIVFLDGDKPIAAKEMKEKHPDVPLIILGVGQDFENLVPEDVYITAVQRIHKDDGGKINLAAFQQWKAQQRKRTWPFSKWVERWLDDQFELSLYKPLAMERAVADVPAANINPAPLRALLSEMRKQLK